MLREDLDSLRPNVSFFEASSLLDPALNVQELEKQSTVFLLADPDLLAQEFGVQK